MKKISLLLIFTTVCSFSQNLISNGAFDSDAGWTIVNHYGAENSNGSVLISDGVATFNQVTSGPNDWKHMGVYTSIVLAVGTYQFDMQMSYANIIDAWGEVYIGSAEPIQHQDYTGDEQILKAYNTWNCSSIKTYNGLAASSGCSEEAMPGQFVINTPGTYYILFRTGGNSYGDSGIEIDNISLVSIATASTNELDKSDLKIFPNPTDASWSFNSDNQKINRISVSNSYGKKVMEFQPEGDSFNINGEGLVSGVYIITITTNEGVFSRKLIKK